MILTSNPIDATIIIVLASILYSSRYNLLKASTKKTAAKNHIVNTLKENWGLGKIRDSI